MILIQLSKSRQTTRIIQTFTHFNIGVYIASLKKFSIQIHEILNSILKKYLSFVIIYTDKDNCGSDCRKKGRLIMSNLAPAVGFFVKVFEALADSATPIGISEISRRTEINKNMVSRILNTLEEEKWVQCDDRSCYRLTLLPFRLSSKVVNRTTLVDTSMPFLQKLWKEYGESTRAKRK